MNKRNIRILLEEIKKGKKVSIESLADRIGLNEDYIRGFVETLKKSGVVKVEKNVLCTVEAGDRLLHIKTLPEINIFKYIMERDGETELKDIFNDISLPKEDIEAGIGRLVAEKIIKISKFNGRRVVELLRDKLPDKFVIIEKLFNKLLNKKRLRCEELSVRETEILKMLVDRPGFLEIRRKVVENIISTDKIDDVLEKMTEKPIATRLTPEIILNRSWSRYTFKKYDVNEKFFYLYPGRVHPMRELIREIKEIFLSMGFEEAVGPLIEVAFINFDMLFQPQDHPARDMQDTFYLKYPEYGEIKYPDELIERIKATHENGWMTDSSGWGGKWSLLEAKKLVLRTHTTSVTVAKVYEIGEKPAKIFSIGRVFRNETIDYKHLAEFMQVDGIIINKSANLKELMGVIKDFYSKLGFKDIRFWPSYFPYTEPSIQPSIYVGKWGKWLELGGAGIFRPEVTIPLGVKWPVLAWGLGIERLLMIKYNIDDIRLIYSNNLEWLRGVGLRL